MDAPNANGIVPAAPPLTSKIEERCHDCSKPRALGKSRCQDCIDTRHANARGVDVAEFRQQRNANAQLGALLSAVGLNGAGNSRQLDAASGKRHCSSGHDAPLSKFDGDQKTCRDHLQEARQRAREERLRRKTDTDSAMATTHADAAMKSEPSTTAATRCFSARDVIDDDPTTTSQSDCVKEKHEFSSLALAEEFVKVLGHEEGCMFLERNSKSQRTEGKLYFRCHCYTQPSADHAGTNSDFSTELSVRPWLCSSLLYCCPQFFINILFQLVQQRLLSSRKQ